MEIKKSDSQPSAKGPEEYFTGNVSAQTYMNNNQSLNVKEQSIVTISAFTAQGDLEQLRKALTARKSLAKAIAARQKKR